MTTVDAQLAAIAAAGIAYRAEVEEVRAWNTFVLAADVEERLQWPLRKEDRP